MRKNTANVAGVRNNAEMAVARQSRVQKNTAKIQAYQRWIMSRPAEYWDETVERRKYNALVFGDECRRNAIIATIDTRRKKEWQSEMDRMFVHMTLTLLDLLCSTEGLSHKWEFSLVADASAALFAQMKRQGGQKAAWAHKQNPIKFAREFYDKNYETVLVRA